MFSWAEQIISGMSRCSGSQCRHCPPPHPSLSSSLSTLFFPLSLHGLYTLGSRSLYALRIYFGSFAGIASIGIGIGIASPSLASPSPTRRLWLRRGSGMGWKNVLYSNNCCIAYIQLSPSSVPLPLSVPLFRLFASLSVCLSLYLSVCLFLSLFSPLLVPAWRRV